jgi:hypothetical protein
MRRHFVLFLLALNTIVIVTAIVVSLFFHQGHRAVEADELERRLSARLSATATPADMQRSSTELAHIMALSDRLVHKSVQLLDYSDRFLLVVSAVNVAFLLVGMWQDSKGAAP